MHERLIGLGLLWLRALMGSGIASHGYQKIFGGRMGKFAEGVAQMGFPFPDSSPGLRRCRNSPAGCSSCWGWGPRYAALAVFLTMSVAAFLRHAADPLSVKELALAYWTIAGTLLCTGGGRYSLDAHLRGRRAS